MGISVIAAFIAGLTFWSSMGSQLPIMPLYIESLGGRDQIGLVMGAFAAGLLFCRGYLGRFTDRYGRRRAMQLGLLVASIIPLFYYLFPQVPIIIALRPIHAISVGAFATGYSALIGDIAPPDRRGEVIGYLSLVNPLGLGIGPALGDFLRESLGFAFSFQMASLFAVVGLIATLFVKDEYKTDRSLARVSLPLWKLIMTPRVRPPAFVLLSIGLIFGIVSTYLPLFLKQQAVGINGGWFYAAAAMAQFIVRVPAAVLGDRFGRGVFISFALGCYALSMLMITFARSSEAFIVAAIIDGIAAGIAIPTLIAWVTDRTVSQERGMVMGTVWAGFDLGIAIAAPALTEILKVFPLSTAFLIASLIAIIALGGFLIGCSDTVPESVQFALGRSKDKYAIGSQT